MLAVRVTLENSVAYTTSVNGSIFDAKRYFAVGTPVSHNDELSKVVSCWLVPDVEYNEDYDRKHYPITQADLDAIGKLIDIVPSLENATWRYFATIHGRIFTASMEAVATRPTMRLGKDQLEKVVAINGLRWTEMAANEFSIGLEHN